jgi:hypothetical protein
MPFAILTDEQRPRKLFHEGLSCGAAAEAEQAGWTLVDVRSMPQANDEDRRAAVKAVLEGIRVGSIIPDPKKLKFLDLEARVLGMIGGKAPASGSGNDDDTIETLLGGKP